MRCERQKSRCWLVEKSVDMPKVFTIILRAGGNPLRVMSLSQTAVNSQICRQQTMQDQKKRQKSLPEGRQTYARFRFQIPGRDWHMWGIIKPPYIPFGLFQPAGRGSLFRTFLAKCIYIHTYICMYEYIRMSI